MGIFSTHQHTNHTMKGASSNHQTVRDENNDQTNSISDEQTSSSAHSNTSSQKTACGCGSCHSAKPIEEEVYEVKEEWDY